MISWLSVAAGEAAAGCSAAAKPAEATELAQGVMHKGTQRDRHGSASQTWSKHNASKFTEN